MVTLSEKKAEGAMGGRAKRIVIKQGIGHKQTDLEEHRQWMQKAGE